MEAINRHEKRKSETPIRDELLVGASFPYAGGYVARLEDVEKAERAEWEKVRAEKLELLTRIGWLESALGVRTRVVDGQVWTQATQITGAEGRGL